MFSGLEISFSGGPALVPAHQLPDPIERLLGEGCACSAFEDALLEEGGMEALATWYAWRPSLERHRLVRYRVLSAGQPMASFIPAVGLASSAAPATARARLSRFAHVRRDGEVMIVDSPRALGRVELHAARALDVVGRLARASDAAALAAELSDDATWIAGLLGMLQSAGIVLPTDQEGATAEDGDPATTGWEFHDLVFHERSRPFRTDRPVGATNRLDGNGRKAANVARQSAGATIVLATPDLDALANNDVPFSRVLESRRSRRFHGDPPITLEQLGEFLSRTMRATSPHADDVELAGRFRVYPGGGACHPLETYVVVARCDGLAPGLYHYRTDSHALAPLECDPAGVQSLIDRSAVPMEQGSAQQVQLVLTAQFARINRRYEGNAYALVLQEVGAVYQTMYLVATAMGLAGCAVGGGDATAFARLIGTNPLDESSVGAFVLGSS